MTVSLFSPGTVAQGEKTQVNNIPFIYFADPSSDLKEEG